MYKRLARFNKKAPTAIKPPYIIFNPHDQTPCQARPDGLIIMTMIDPGIKNCAFRTSSYDPKTGISKTLLLKKLDFTNSKEHYYVEMIVQMEEFKQYFINSHYIGIESQLPINYDLVRMGQHITTYLLTIVRNNGVRPLIVELDPHLKSRMLNAPAKMTKPQLKLWATTKGIELLKACGEFDVAAFVESQKKADDYGDVICYEKCMIIILRGEMNPIPLPSQKEEVKKRPNFILS